MKRALLGCALISGTELLWSAPARAEENTVRGAGIVGGALALAEATVTAEALASVEPEWAYAAGAAAGAAAGGYIGWRVERDAEPRASEVLLGVGLGLLIPTLVWVGNLRQERVPGKARRAGQGTASWAQVPLGSASVFGESARRALELRSGIGMQVALFRGTF